MACLSVFSDAELSAAAVRAAQAMRGVPAGSLDALTLAGLAERIAQEGARRATLTAHARLVEAGARVSAGGEA